MPAAKELGPIREDQTYPLEVFSRLTGLSKWALRQARREGLRSVRVGNRTYYRGRDWDAWLASRAEQQAAAAAN